MVKNTIATATGTLADAISGSEGGDKLILQAKENNKIRGDRVREMRTLFHSTFVKDVDKRFPKNWDAYEAAKDFSRKLGEEGGPEYDRVMNLVKAAFTSRDVYVEILRLLGQNEAVDTYLASRIKADRVIELKNAAHEVFVKRIPKGLTLRWDVFDGARQLYRDLGEEGGPDYDYIMEELKNAYTSKQAYEDCITFLGGSIEPPAKETTPAKAETVKA
jgi:hypothetical protein